MSSGEKQRLIQDRGKCEHSILLDWSYVTCVICRPIKKDKHIANEYIISVIKRELVISQCQSNTI